MISKNNFLPGRGEGWPRIVNGHEVYLIQGRPETPESLRRDMRRAADYPRVRSVDSRLEARRDWESLSRLLPTLDRVIVYVGTDGSDENIDLAAKHCGTRVPVTFVFCDCNLDLKKQLLASNGFDREKFVLCLCGGKEKMEEIYERFIETGELPV